MTAFWDHFLDLLWAPLLVIITWAFQLDRRVSRLETQREAMVESIASIKSDVIDLRDDVRESNEKLDRILGKLS